ncbi:hypothetical protein AR687_16410 [Flavobacteriaceae bacterium CRH]|nr:hypothetical protein AR687_16410 [Flavobacteriaceae bacterium CRH]
MIANDCTIDFQSKSADYYQSSYLITRRELNFGAFRLYKFNQSSLSKTIFSIVLNYIDNKDVFSFQIRLVQNLQTLLFQNLSSFIKQSVFVNETINSSNFKTSLYTA